MTKAAQMRLGAILRLLGYNTKPVWIGGRTVRRWTKTDRPNKLP